MLTQWKGNETIKKFLCFKGHYQNSKRQNWNKILANHIFDKGMDILHIQRTLITKK